MSLINILLIIIGFLTFFLGALVFWRNRQHLINKTFTLFLIATGAWPFAIAFFQASQNPTFLYLWDIIIYVSGIFVPALFVLFAYAFTKNRLPQRRKMLVLLLTPLFLLSLLLIPNLWIKNIELLANQKIVTFGPAYILWMLYYALFMIWGAWLFYRAYRSSQGSFKLQMRLVLIGLLFPIVGAVMPNIILPFLGDYRWIALGPIFLTPMNIIISYAIIKHRFMDIRLIFVRSLTYAILIVFLGLFYSSLIFLMSTYVQIFDNRITNILISTVIALFIAYTFQPLQDYFGKITDSIFYKDRYSKDKVLRSLSKTMALTRNLNKLTQKLLSIIRKHLKISWTSFVIGSETNRQTIISDPETHKKKLTPEIIDKLTTKKNLNRMLIYEDLKEGSAKQLMRKLSIAVIVHLVTKNQEIGFLIIGDKSSGEPYYSQDLSLFEIVGPEFAIALQNAQRYEEIKSFNLTLQEEVKKATKDLRQALQRLKELDKLKDEFISIASHELRTPASIMKNYLYLILKQEKNLPKHIYRRLERVYQANLREIKLINDMLDVQKIESQRIKLKPQQFNLTELAQTVIEELYPKAKERNIKLKLRTREAFLVLADPNRIHQIISNLVDNALKFTPQKGEVTVSIARLGKTVTTSVKDTGIGVSRENLAKLFTKFGKLDVDEAEFTETPGSGLGLYICNLLVNLSGGKISFDSELGKGTTVSFTLPAA